MAEFEVPEDEILEQDVADDESELAEEEEVVLPEDNYDEEAES